MLLAVEEEQMLHQKGETNKCCRDEQMPLYGTNLLLMP
jgi:hypothetical protein